MKGAASGVGTRVRPRSLRPALVAALMALLSPALDTPSRRAAAQVGPSVVPEVAGDGAWSTWGSADFGWRIRSLDGVEAVPLEEFRGQVLFINLWASWCPPCVRELRSIQRLRSRLADTGITFLLVAAEGEAPVRRFLRQYPMEPPIYLEVSRMRPSWGLRGLPTTWVVDRDGAVVLLRHGEAVWDTDAVEAFLRRVAERGEAEGGGGNTRSGGSGSTAPGGVVSGLRIDPDGGHSRPHHLGVLRTRGPTRGHRPYDLAVHP